VNQASNYQKEKTEDHGNSKIREVMEKVRVKAIIKERSSLKDNVITP